MTNPIARIERHDYRDPLGHPLVNDVDWLAVKGGNQALADRLIECCTFPDGTAIADHGQPWGADVSLLREAAAALTSPQADKARGEVEEGCTPTDAKVLRKANHDLAGENGRLREALQFYADKNHFILAIEDAWDTVSGEPQNLWCDEEGTATVEDGTIARNAIQTATTPQPQGDASPEVSGDGDVDRLAALCRLYTAGYRHGHHSTVEGGYTDVLYTDAVDYFADEVAEILEDRDFAALSTPQARPDALPDLPFDTIREVVRALTWLGVSAPLSHEEQAARCNDLVLDLCREVNRTRDEQARPATSTEAEDRFEQYVATLIDKAPNAQKLGERLAELLDSDHFNNVEPQLLALARMEAEQARPDGGEVIRWPNWCDTSVPEALRYLSKNERPKGGCERFNAEHLLQLANEIELMAKKLREAHPAPAPDVARLVEAAANLSNWFARDISLGHVGALREALAPFTAAQQEGGK